MSDLARDPVFGEVARALQPRATRSREVSGPLSLRHIATTSCNARGLSREDRELLRRAIGIHVLAAGNGRDRVSGLRRTFAELARTHPKVDALFAAFVHAQRPFALPRMQGIVNVTPDSFSDGGRFLDAARAIEHGLKLVDEGADLLDVGGESTRPDSAPVPLDEELRRVVPVIAGLAERTKIPISIDTTKSAVARAALDAGASIVNDISAGRFDPAILEVTAAHGAGFIAMHMQGEPRTMQAAPTYVDVVGEVLEHLRERCATALEAGIERSKLWIDPGIGFGKALEHNLELLRRLPELRSLGLPIVLGVSRKSFITKITGRDTPPEERIGGSAAALALGVIGGAEIFRVHDVAVMREAALVARAITGT